MFDVFLFVVLWGFIGVFSRLKIMGEEKDHQLDFIDYGVGSVQGLFGGVLWLILLMFIHLDDDNRF